MRQERVMEAYDYCRRVTQRASKTFYWGSVFLPQPKRRAIWAVYALCRMMDDIVDEATDSARVGHLGGATDPQATLDGWRQALTTLYTRGGSTGGPIQLAWSDLLTHYPVPLAPALELIEGVAMDLAPRRYATFDDLYLYCYRVAGTVGLLTTPIFGYQDEAALQHAAELGVALQLTNILRDIGEDARRNRIYLPVDEMRHFGYSECDMMHGVINDAFCELLRFQMARAEGYYQRSQSGIALLSEDCRLAVSLSSALYRRILECIRLNNYNVFTRRASVPLQTRLVAASQYWLLQQLAMYVKG